MILICVLSLHLPSRLQLGDPGTINNLRNIAHSRISTNRMRSSRALLMRCSKLGANMTQFDVFAFGQRGGDKFDRFHL